MNDTTPFLTAEWRNLINLTYTVNPDLLFPYLPDGLELEMKEGKSFVSLVAFDFLHTKVKGVKIPFHVHFPEINLRFYVRKGSERGVVFIREFVPKHAIAAVARWIYNEPYKRAPMRSSTQGNDTNFYLKIGSKTHSISVKTAAQSHIPEETSLAHFFKEHETGFGKTRSGKMLSYKVEHPIWAVRKITQLDLDFDFGEVYGKEWSCLNHEEPLLSIFAEGSPIKVFPLV